MAFLLLKNWPIAMAENIVTALVTEADIPANTAKNHRNNTTKTSFMTFPFLYLSKGFNTKESIHKIIPTCNPDTAKI